MLCDFVYYYYYFLAALHIALVRRRCS